MRKFIKFLIGLLLLPLCIGLASAVGRILVGFNGANATWALLAVGAATWLVIYLLCPRPMWLYVFGHELSHAVWACCFGGTVRGFKVSAGGGHVNLSKSNFVIALAPYFFPFYAVIVVLLFLLGRLILPWTRLEFWFLLCLGAAYAFHVTLTAHVLKTRQSDITEHGYVFSAVIILIGNLLVLLIGLPLLTSDPTIHTALGWSWEGTVDTVRFVRGWFD